MTQQQHRIPLEIDVQIILFSCSCCFQVCNQCKSSFGVLLWRHHCRICGVIFCDGCLQRVLVQNASGGGKDDGRESLQTVCSWCLNVSIHSFPVWTFFCTQPSSWYCVACIVVLLTLPPLPFRTAYVHLHLPEWPIFLLRKGSLTASSAICGCSSKARSNTNITTAPSA